MPILEIKRISDPADPRRCQAIAGSNQCFNIASENSKFCLVHGGNCGTQLKKQADLHNYRLNKFRAQVADKADSRHIKSLREEIGVLRLLLEEQINRCANVNELILNQGPIADLIMRIERLVTACNKLDLSVGKMLDETRVLQFADEVITLITEFVKDQEIINKISGRLDAAMRSLSSEEAEDD
jgi:hypothetical protein